MLAAASWGREAAANQRSRSRHQQHNMVLGSAADAANAAGTVSWGLPCVGCRVFGGSTSLSIIDSMQQVVVDIRVYLLYLLLMVRGRDKLFWHMQQH